MPRAHGEDRLTAWGKASFIEESWKHALDPRVQLMPNNRTTTPGNPFACPIPSQASPRGKYESHLHHTGDLELTDI